MSASFGSGYKCTLFKGYFLPAVEEDPQGLKGQKGEIGAQGPQGDTEEKKEVKDGLRSK